MTIYRALLFAVCLLPAATMAQPAAPRARLQIQNAGSVPLTVFWLKSETERVQKGDVPPGGQTILNTTVGHRFALVGGGETVATVTSEVRVQCFRYQPDDHDGIPPFYTQLAHAHGFPIVASPKVNPYALKEAVYLVDLMLANRPDVREAMIKSGARMCVMAHDEFTTDLPEFAWLGKEKMRGFEALSGKDFWDARARGLGGSETDPYCSVAEENLLGLVGDPYEKECILIHEFAHNIHLRGLANVDPTFDKRLKATYDAAMKAGLWKGKYAATNHHEYFAEGVQSWFDNNRVNDHDHNHVNTRALLIEYDPELAAMCREVFGDTAIKYTKPATRLSGHMAGYDPDSAPAFRWPARLLEAQRAIRGQAVARDEAANGKPLRETRTIEGWTVYVHRDLLDKEGAQTEHALELLRKQLEEIVQVVPAAAVVELRKVPLYFSPEYPGIQPRAEYHPGADWLKENGRDPAMAKGIEFTNVGIFDVEVRRMPNFALHELAHAYHDLVLPKGFKNPEIIAAYDKAKASGGYDRVERTDAEGNKRMDRAYAMTNPQEYFAESTEAFFSRNDFIPFTREELKKHDPTIYALLEKLWGTTR
ncbi:MAG: hypothetical protein M9921_11845 [Fimbriimonadaceae bacterium]|nr:hypothetical protein [Fimbriimonadaceae bacterium]